MIAEMNSGAVVGIVAIPAALMAVIITCLIRHVSKAEKHPCKEDIDIKFGKVVFKDVCDERTKRIEEQITNVDKNMTAGFKRVENLIKDNHN